MRSVAVSSKTPSATAAARATRSTASAPCCGPGSRSSPTGSGTAWSGRSTSALSTTPSGSPGPSPNGCVWPTSTPARPRAA
jgi:hypothetical protein